MQGYLYEKVIGLISSTYNKYWFSLENDTLVKFKNVNFVLTENIDLRAYKQVITPISKKKKKIISLVHQNDSTRDLYYEGDIETFNMWVHLINNSISNIKSNLIKEKFDIIKIIPDACAITNDKFNILETNPQLKKITGYTREDLIGKNIKIIMMNYSKFYDELFNHKKKSEKIIRKIFISNKEKNSKVPVSVTINEYIIPEILERIYIFTFKSLNDDNDIQLELLDTRPSSYVGSFFQVINENSEKSKKLAMEYCEKLEQVVQCYEQKIIVIEEENKILINSNNDLVKRIRELENNLNYYKRKSGQATILNVLSQDIPRFALKEFCIENKTEENLLFWEEVNKFKTKYLSNSNSMCDEIPDDLKRDIDNIYNKYIDPNSKYQINISGKMRDDIKYQKENELDLYNIFDRALYDILQLLNTDVYPIFCSTQAGRKVISLFN